MIKIHYKMLNSNQYQTFRVTVFCSINGGLESKLKSLSGDYGENVVGGRTDYLVLWDVLKDVDEVKSVDFSVRAELLKDVSPELVNKSKNAWSDKKIYIIAAGGEGKGALWGPRLAYMGSWGVSAKYCWISSGDREPLNKSYSSIDVTKRLVNKGGFQLHLIAGFAHAYYGSTYEIGTIFAIRRFVMTMAITPSIPPNTEDAPKISTNWGIGVRF